MRRLGGCVGLGRLDIFESIISAMRLHAENEGIYPLIRSQTMRSTSFGASVSAPESRRSLTASEGARYPSSSPIPPFISSSLSCDAPGSCRRLFGTFEEEL